jgi:hypothetical protein
MTYVAWVAELTRPEPAKDSVAEAIIYLQERGYRVSKARSPRKAQEVTDTGCVHCNAYGSHIARIGRKATATRGQPVAVCESCRRFGPGLHGVPNVPADPGRYMRLVVAWRHAQHRYASTIRNTDRYGRLESRAHPRLVAIVEALNRAEFVRAA